MQAEAAEVKPSAEVIPIGKLILGGRTLEAVKVRERADEVFDDLKNRFEHMSGFFIVAFDDEGFAEATLHLGSRFPIPPNEVVTSVSELVKHHVYGVNE